MEQETLSSGRRIAEGVRSGELSPVAVAEEYLDRIESRDDEVNAYVTVTDGIARESAAAVETAVEDGADPGPLGGVPVALKDLTYMKEGVPHSFGSAIFAGMEFAAPRTTAVVERLEDAGAVILGKTNTPEFGHKGMTDNEVIGATATPFDTSKNAGGSSGGSAAAVAAGTAPLAVGSDAGGSIRIPAALCGVYGLKPSFGVIPRDARPSAFGGEPLHAVLGPLTRTVEDAALLMDVMSGIHPCDPGSVPVGMDFRAALDRSIDGLRIGYSADLGAFEIDDDVAAVVEDALGAFEAAGATVEEATVEHGLSTDGLFEPFLTTFATQVAGTEAVLAEGLGIELRDRADALSDSLLGVLEIADDRDLADVAASGIPRTQLFDGVQAALGEYDLLVTPTLGSAAIDLHQGFEEHLDWAREGMLTWPFNVTGHPAANVPAGVTDDGLPAGLQIVGRRYADDTVLAASAAVERERPWRDIYPH